MAAVVVPNAFLLAASGTIIGKPWTNVIGVRSGPDGSETGVEMTQALASHLGNSLRAGYQSVLTSWTTLWTLTQILVYDLQSDSSPTWDAQVASLTGSSATDPYPPHFAACVTHRTAFRGRSRRGRTYLAGLTEGASAANGVLATTTRANMELVFSTFRTQLNTSFTSLELHHAVVSRKLEEAFVVVSSRCDEHVDHQDRRKR